MQINRTRLVTVSEQLSSFIITENANVVVKKRENTETTKIDDRYIRGV